MASTRFERHPALTVSVVSIVGAILLLLAMEAAVRWLAPAIIFRGTDARLIAARTFFDTHGNARNFNGQAFGIPVHIDADGSQKDIEALVAQSQKRSAVYDIITNPTNVNVEVVAVEAV